MNAKQHTGIQTRESGVDRKALLNADVAYFSVEGMLCRSCAAKIRNNLLEHDAVLVAEASLSQSLVGVIYTPAEKMPEELFRAIESASDNPHIQFTVTLLETGNYVGVRNEFTQ